MATYKTDIRTPMAPEQAFAYMADLRNFAEWDPGVAESNRVGDETELGAEFDVYVKMFNRKSRMRYRITEFEPHDHFVATSTTSTIKSVDTITVRPDTDGGNGSIVTYHAELTLLGLLKIGEPVLALTFKRIGDRAAEGLETALDGTRIQSVTR